MTSYINNTSRFDDAVKCLPQKLRRELCNVSKYDKDSASEIRLRLGQMISLNILGKEKHFGNTAITHEDLSSLIELNTGASIHSCSSFLKDGFITTESGFRIGITGECNLSSGEIAGFRSYSGACIRISREIYGCGNEVIRSLTEDGEFVSTLIISPPGGGKTTLLRDLIRFLSDGIEGREYRVAVCDERGEICAQRNGKSAFNVGNHTDILSLFPKDIGMMMLIRSMSPEIIAVDEITDGRDIEAMKQITGCGCRLLATAHGVDTDDILRRRIYREMLAENIFKKAVVIGKNNKYSVLNI